MRLILASASGSVRVYLAGMALAGIGSNSGMLARVISGGVARSDIGVLSVSFGMVDEVVLGNFDGLRSRHRRF